MVALGDDLDTVAWGAAHCSTGCMRLAELAIDREPFCVDCADEWITNEGALPLWVEHRVEEAAMRPLKPIYRQDTTPVTSWQLEAMHAAWLRWQAEQVESVTDAERCWAVLSAIRGNRCARAATGSVLCVEHAASGALVPSQGWTDGLPAGELLRLTR